MIDGCEFNIRGKAIISEPAEIEFAIARRIGGELNINTGKSRFSVSLP
jgi:hypothetical protein